MADLSVVVASGFGALLGGGVGAVTSVLVARVHEQGAGREEWYRRFQHVSTMVVSPDGPLREAGLAMLQVLIADPGRRAHGAATGGDPLRTAAPRR